MSGPIVSPPPPNQSGPQAGEHSAVAPPLPSPSRSSFSRPKRKKDFL